MKIAMYHELPKGGARKSVNEIARFLKKNNTVDLYTLKDITFLPEDKYFTNVYLFPFQTKAWTGNSPLTRFYKDTIELYRLYALNKQISKIIKLRHYDVLFVHASKYIEAPFILRFKNTMKVYFLHDPYFRYIYEPDLHTIFNLAPHKQAYESVRRKILKVLDAQNVSKSNFVIANSKFSKKNFKEAYGPNSRVSYLGVNIDFFKPSQVSKKYDVLYVGSKSLIDGYDTVQNLLQVLDKNLKFKTLLAEDEWIDSDIHMRTLYQESKVVLCLGRSEPFGLTPLEAGACGVPVIAVDEGGYRETILKGETGILVKRDIKELANSIYTLLHNKALQKKMGKQARDYVEKKWSSEYRYSLLEQTLVRITKT